MATAEVKARLTLDSMAFQAGLNRAMGGMTRFGAIVAATGVQLVAFGIRSAEALGRMGVEGVKSAYELGHELTDLSAQTGIAVDELEKLRVIFKAGGLGEEEVGKIVNKMQKYIAANKELKALSPDKQFLAIVQAIKNIEDPAERAEKALEIFGKGGGKVLALRTQDLEDAAKFMGSAGRVLKANSEDFERASVILNRAGDKIKFFWVGFASKITESILPLLESLDKIDSAAIGERVGEGFKTAAFALTGAIAEGGLGELTEVTVTYGLLKARDTFIVAMRDGLLKAVEAMQDKLKAVVDKILLTTDRDLAEEAVQKGKAAQGKTGSSKTSPPKEKTDTEKAYDRLTAAIEKFSKAGERFVQDRKPWGMSGGGYNIADSRLPNVDLGALDGKNKSPSYSSLQRIGGGIFGGAAAVHTVASNTLSEVVKIGRLLQKIAGGNSVSFARLDNF